VETTGKKPGGITGKGFRPGQSGNPGGRPKKTRLSDATREWLEEIDPKTGKTNAQIVAEAQGESAKKGNTAAYNAIADRTEGKARQAFELSGPDGADIPVDLKLIDEEIAELLLGAGLTNLRKVARKKQATHSPPAESSRAPQ